jgi:hypothetical protein
MKLKNRLLAGMWVIGLGLACASARAEMGFDQAWANAQSEGFSTLERTSDGIYGDPVVLLIQSEKEWNQRMAEMSIIAGPASPPPVDWSREAVVLVSLGEYASGPASVEILAVRRLGHRLLVDIRAVLPGPIQFFCAPCHVIKVRRNGGAFELESRMGFVTSDVPLGKAQGHSWESPAGSVQHLSWGALKTADFK